MSAAYQNVPISVAIENILFELILYAVFFCICAYLLNSRCSRKRTALTLAGSIAVSAAIQAAILFTASDAVELILTQLPLSAYLPVIVAVHILAKGGFAAALATWCMGLLASYTIVLFREVILEIWTKVPMPVSYVRLLLLGSLLLGVLLAFTVIRFCRKPFQIYEFRDKYVWLIFPVVLLFSLISYIENMAHEPFASFLLFSISLIMFAFLIKFLNVSMSERIAKASEQEIARQMAAQRQELLRIDQIMEQGRIYRHDMRHHLSVLYELAEGEKTEDIREYISSLDNRLSELEKERYCENTAVNAVLCSYIGKARQAGIRTEVKVDFPKELPIDAFDLCAVLANALNNAVIASGGCRAERWISISCFLLENGNISLDVKNPFDTPVEFGKDGLPVSHGGEEHGFGLKSIDAIVKKYNGALRCTCDGGIFRLCAVLFSPNNIQAAANSFPLKKLISNTAVLMLLAVFLLNFMPGALQAAAAVPILGSAIRMLDIRTYHNSFYWGSSGFQMDAPQIEPAPGPAGEVPELSDGTDEINRQADSSDGTVEMNRQMETCVEQIKNEFLYCFSRKYDGYAASDTGYRVLRNDEYLLSIQFYTTVNMGSSISYSRCFTLDRTSGTVLRLADLFAEGSDYVGVISADILRQMTERVAAGQGSYYIPGGIFSDEECFKAISADQEFYIDEDGKLIIVFDEYEVAPGSTGTPQFTVEPETLREILRQPSMLSPAGKEPE